jgi:hypothetical protein
LKTQKDGYQDQFSLPWTTKPTSKSTTFNFRQLNRFVPSFESYLGLLTFEPKWNPAHFTQPPNSILTDAISMAEFERQNRLHIGPALFLPPTVNSVELHLPPGTNPDFV